MAPFIFAIGIYFFKFPNNFSTGGVSGISILLGRIFPSFSTADIMWIINIILLIVGFIILGRGFGVLTVYCSMLLSFLTWLFEKGHSAFQAAYRSAVPRAVLRHDAAGGRLGDPL